MSLWAFQGEGCGQSRDFAFCAQCSLSDSVVNASNASFVGEPECIQDDVARFSC